MDTPIRDSEPVTDPRRRRLPPWLKRPLPSGSALAQTRRLLDNLELNTVCVEARCPNLTECWSRRTATFMILGERCTRNCRFCAVTSGDPEPVSADEPQRLASAAERLKLKHAVITSVTRDDLPDEGADQFAACIRTVRERLPEATVEVLTPDFHARRDCLQTVLDANPTVFNHNLETVARLHPPIRPQADYERSLRTLELARELRPDIRTKSGLMVGLGETDDELIEALRDLRRVGCDLVTIGQYLRPARDERHVPVQRFYSPDEFDALAEQARQIGFLAVASGPFVRSSYLAEKLYAGMSHAEPDNQSTDH